jgi:hypothetical protein
MNKHLATLVLAVLMGILGFAVSGVAVAGTADKPPAPPGQGECNHGNADKECKADPQPEHGKDCEAHGNSGGVNEDHCRPQETTPTTPTETTPTTPTETTPTTPVVTTPTETTPNVTTPQSTTPTQAPEPSSTESTPSTPTIVGLPPVAPAAKKQAAAKEQVTAVDAASANAPKPTQQAQQAPLTL